ncbi:MAG: type II toxin-antitoxin system HicB family antitoxin [Candidatus Zixiibacteriota bacterium]
MRKYQVYLEINNKGYCMAHVRELPGCFVWDDTKNKVLKKLPEAIKDYLIWMKKNGENNLIIPKKIEFEIVETQKGTCPVISGNKAALFSYDLIPPANSFIKRCLKWMRYNRKELLNRVKKLSDEVLDWKPNKDKRSIRETLNHIANAEWWYLSRMKDEKELETLPYKVPSEKIFEKLEEVRKLAIKILKNLSKEDRNRVNIPKRYVQYKGEKWTFGKVLRRFLEHEREHIGTIDKTLKLYNLSLKKG